MNWRGLRRLGPWWGTAAIGTSGLLLISQGLIRPGGYLLAASFGVAALLRVMLAPGRAGGLGVRRPSIDVFCWLGLALALVVAFSLVRLTP